MLASGRRRKRPAAGNHAVCSADERCTRLVCGAGEPPARWAFGGTGRCSKRPASQRGGSDSSWNRSGAGRRVAVSSRWSGRCTAAAASGGPSSAAPDGGAWCRASRRSSGWSRRCAAAASSSGSGVAREVERGVGHRVESGGVLQPWRTGMPRGGGRLRCAMSSSWSSAPRASGAAHHVCRRGEPLQVARPFGGWKSGVCPGAPGAASRSRNALAGTRPRSSRTSGCRFRAFPLPLYRAPGRCAQGRVTSRSKNIQQ